MLMWRIQERSETVAAFIRYGNIVLIILLALFAVFGIVAIFNKKLREKAGLALLAFCAAVITAFALEATAFNFMHYLKFFAGPQTSIAYVSPDAPDVLIMTDDARGEVIGEREIHIKNLNRKVYSVFIDMEFNGFEMADVTVAYTDDGSTYQYKKPLYNFLPHENYIPLQPSGKVYDISIAFTEKLGDEVNIQNIVINKPIPIYFSGLRILAASLLLFALFVIVHKDLRARAAYWLFEYKFDPKNRRQSVGYACAVVLLVLYCWVCVYTSVSFKEKYRPLNFIYQKCLVDALIAGRTNLDYGSPQKLLALERPYDVREREAAGFDEGHDWVWYKGKYYCYYGVVPAALVNVPYRLISGDYLSDYISIFFYCAVSVILLAALWRHLCKRYMPNIRYVHYLLSIITLFFASGIFILLRYATFYSVVQSAGFMFTVAGVLLLLKSVDGGKVKYPYLFFASLCMALVFGCRPNLGLASFLVPVVLWKHRSWKLAAFTLLPYIMVAIPLCLYNYVRFGSIFEFGVNYVLTAFNIREMAHQNILSKIFKAIIASVRYLFCPLRFSLQFPFVEVSYVGTGAITRGLYWFFPGAIGIINFPIVFCLFYLFKNKNKPNYFYLLSASLIVGIAIIVLNSILQGCSERFMPDIAIFIVFPSLVCAYYWCFDAGKENGGGDEHLFVGRYVRLGVTYALLAACVFVGSCLCVSGVSTYNNSTLYRYLEVSLGFLN